MRLSRLLPAIASLAFFACQDPTTGTSDEHETSMARLYHPDGTPAARAKVKFYPVSDTAQVPAALTYTTENGEIQLPDLPAGMYNAVASDGSGTAALIDSIVYSANGKASVLSDTLKPMGVLRGRVVVQPQHSPQIAWIQVVGMGVAANVDSLGRFEISLPAGRATVYALTREAHYTPTFQVVTAGTGVTRDLSDIRLIYTGIPVVTGLEVQYDSLSAIATVRWNRSTGRAIMGYLVEIGGDSVGRGRVVIRSPLDTMIIDSVYTLKTKFDDLVLPRRREYSVRAIDSASDTGSAWIHRELKAASPLLIPKMDVIAHPLADRPVGCRDVDTLAGGLVCIGYYMISSTASLDYDDGIQNLDSIQVWTSQNGLVWSHKLPIPGSAFNVIAWRGLIWVARGWWSPESTVIESGGQTRNVGLLRGVVVEAWNPSGTLVRKDTLPDSGEVYSHRLLVSGDSLLLVKDSGSSPSGMHFNKQGKLVLNEADGKWTPDPIHMGLVTRVSNAVLDGMIGAIIENNGLERHSNPNRWDWFGLGVEYWGHRWLVWNQTQAMPWMIAAEVDFSRTLHQYRGRSLGPGSMLIAWKDCLLLQGAKQSLSMLCPDP